MANPEHLGILQQVPQQGVNKWNEWRKANPDVKLDLRDANLAGIRCSLSAAGRFAGLQVAEFSSRFFRLIVLLQLPVHHPEQIPGL